MQTVALVSKQGLKIGFVFVKRFCIFPLEGSSAGLPEQQKVLNGCVVDIRWYYWDCLYCDVKDDIMNDTPYHVSKLKNCK